MPFTTIAAIGVAVIFLMLLVIFLIPSNKKVAKKKDRPADQQPKETDWQSVAHKLEGHIKSLRQDLAQKEKQEKALDRQLLEAKAEIKELEEKVSLEDGWIKKEQEEIDKRTKELVHVKAELKKTESQLGEEHGLRLRYERELKELKQNFESSDALRKKADVDILKLQAALETAEKDVRELKRENIQLKKKDEDKQFVAKVEYEKIERQLKETQKELERIKREVR